MSLLQETVLEGLQRASCYTRGCLVPEHALDDSAFAPSSRSPSGPPTATPICEPPLQPGRGLLQTQDPWCAHAYHSSERMVWSASQSWYCVNRAACVESRLSDEPACMRIEM